MRGWKRIKPMSWNRCVFFLIIVAIPAFAQETPLDKLEHEMDELAHKTKEELIQQIRELKKEIQALKQQAIQNDPGLGGTDSEYEALQRENHQLKKALKALATGNASVMEQPVLEPINAPNT